MDQFLAAVERKAFRMAQLAVKNEADALDIVQDSMIKLAQSYGHWQGTEQSQQWRALFYRILQNSILDFHRSQSRWRRWFTPQPTTSEDDDNWLEQHSQAIEFGPDEYLQQQHLGKRALAAIEALPLKQQQCFLLRSWEGLSVEETAAALNISPGSIKTHYFRALKKLQQVLHEEAE
ncbi:RNA polymerase subunit sigma-70 [Bacterioplanes sanyensis]|uniref:RNA polymerase subunit sigma-70 n=1 Tax=Bacterioplanes sanyensis TaxID=1249553 RepID=A0A222FPS2_9GAMM|nr:RNA polymerase subunit sigma-70 [Bacterioplanes sanyensis]